jgi:hypothetical protein
MQDSVLYSNLCFSGKIVPHCTRKRSNEEELARHDYFLNVYQKYYGALPYDHPTIEESDINDLATIVDRIHAKIEMINIQERQAEELRQKQKEEYAKQEARRAKEAEEQDAKRAKEEEEQEAIRAKEAEERIKYLNEFNERVGLNLPMNTYYDITQMKKYVKHHESTNLIRDDLINYKLRQDELCSPSLHLRSEARERGEIEISGLLRVNKIDTCYIDED